MTSKHLTKTMAALLVALSVAPAAFAANSGHDSHTPGTTASPSAKADAKASAKPDAKASAKADAKASAKPDAKASAKADAKPDAKASAKPDAKASAKPTNASKPAAKGALAVNSNVQVKWDGHWYAGTVREVKADKVLVRWAHSSKDAWIKAAYVRQK